MMTIHGLGEEVQTTAASTPPTVTGMDVQAEYECSRSTTCVPFFQRVAEVDGKCGCQFEPSYAAMGAFLLPVMPALMVIQKTCGPLGRGGDSMLCKTVNSPSMAIPGLALNLVGWWLIYKYVFKGSGK